MFHFLTKTQQLLVLVLGWSACAVTEHAPGYSAVAQAAGEEEALAKIRNECSHFMPFAQKGERGSKYERSPSYSVLKTFIQEQSNKGLPIMDAPDLTVRMAKHRELAPLNQLLVAMNASFGAAKDGVSPAHPRLLQFHGKTGFLMGSNTHPLTGLDGLPAEKQKAIRHGNRLLEIFEYDPTVAYPHNPWRPREIVLGNPPMFNDQPTHCAACHERPIWPGTPVWVGTGGGLGNRLVFEEGYRHLSAVGVDSELFNFINAFNLSRAARDVRALEQWTVSSYRRAVVAALLNCENPAQYLDDVSRQNHVSQITPQAYIKYVENVNHRRYQQLWQDWLFFRDNYGLVDEGAARALTGLSVNEVLPNPLPEEAKSAYKEPYFIYPPQKDIGRIGWMWWLLGDGAKIKEWSADQPSRQRVNYEPEGFNFVGYASSKGIERLLCHLLPDYVEREDNTDVRKALLSWQPLATTHPEDEAYNQQICAALANSTLRP